jgi:hypothetical protein
VQREYLVTKWITIMWIKQWVGWNENPFEKDQNFRGKEYCSSRVWFCCVGFYIVSEFWEFLVQYNVCVIVSCLFPLLFLFSFSSFFFLFSQFWFLV